MPRGGSRGKKSHKGQRRMFSNELDQQSQLEKEEKERQWKAKKGLLPDDDVDVVEAENENEVGHENAATGLPASDNENESSEDDDDDDSDRHKGVDYLIEIENPNRQGAKQTKKVTELDGKAQLTRREREEFERQQAKAHYQKLHLEGKTEEAREDLARLALIRKQREDAAKKREEERKARESVKDAAEQKLLQKRKENK